MKGGAEGSAREEGLGREWASSYDGHYGKREGVCTEVGGGVGGVGEQQTRRNRASST